MTAVLAQTVTVDRPVRMLHDALGRRVDHLRMSVTDRCDLRCRYCRPFSTRRREPVYLSDSQRARFLRMLVQSGGLKQVRFTGGEPLLHGTLIELISAARQLSRALDIAITTNGQRLQESADSLRLAGLTRVNVSLDTLDPRLYRDLTGGDFDAVLRGLEAARRCGLSPIRINSVVLADVNDNDLPAMARWARIQGFELRFLEAMPIGPARAFNQAQFVGADRILQRLRREFHVRDAGRTTGSTAHHYRLIDGDGETAVGIVAPVTRPFCGDCRRMRLTADGRLYPCLQDPQCVALGSLLAESDDDEPVWERIAAALADKAAFGSMQSAHMVQLGG